MDRVQEYIATNYPQLVFVNSSTDIAVIWELVYKLPSHNTQCVITHWSSGNYRIDYRKEHKDDIYGKVYDTWNASNGFLPSISFVYNCLDRLLN